MHAIGVSKSFVPEVGREANQWNQTARVQRFDASADRPCAWVLAKLVGRSLSDAQRSRVLQMLIIALTHAVIEVRWYAAWGVGENLWTTDRALTLRCVNALATEARLLQQAFDEEHDRLLREKEFSTFHSGEWVSGIAAAVASTVRQRFFQVDGISDAALQEFDPSQWFGAEANGRILAILGRAPAEPAAITAFERLTHTLVAWWDADDDRHTQGRERQRDRHHEAEGPLRELLHNFLLRTSADAAAMILAPILDSVDRHPHEVQRILLGLIFAEDRQANTKQFWLLWRLFADRVRGASWLAGIDREYASGDEMISAIFLGPWWKKEVRHWRSLEGHVENLHTLFEDLPASSTVLEDYLGFLYHIGEQSLPVAFIRIANRLQQGMRSRC